MASYHSIAPARSAQEPPCGKPRPMGIMRKSGEVSIIPRKKPISAGTVIGVGPGLFLISRRILPDLAYEVFDYLRVAGTAPNLAKGSPLLVHFTHEERRLRVSSSPP
jgi:hypothetical protein